MLMDLAMRGPVTKRGRDDEGVRCCWCLISFEASIPPFGSPTSLKLSLCHLPAGEEARKVFVYNLPFNMDWQELKRHFRAAGQGMPFEQGRYLLLALCCSCC